MKDPHTPLIMLCAMRYALGRQTYMPSVVQGYIRGNREELDFQTINVMIRDIDDADRIDGGLGDAKIDRPGWLTFREWLQGQLDEKQ